MHGPESWGDIAIDLADPTDPKRGRIGIERKKIGDNAVFVLRSRAENHGWSVHVIGRDEPWPTQRDATMIHVREYVPQETKGARAEGPAAEQSAGRVHLVDPDGRFSELENECTTYVQGVTRRSPNRLDAYAYAIVELREMKLDARRDHARDAEGSAAANRALASQLSGEARGAAVVGGLSGARSLGRKRMGL
jgi:hypothetical protein